MEQRREKFKKEVCKKCGMNAFPFFCKLGDIRECEDCHSTTASKAVTFVRD